MTHDSITVSSKGKAVYDIPAKRIVLEYPELSGRPEVCMSQTNDGYIWAAIGFNTGQQGSLEHINQERIFYSNNRGDSWQSKPISPTGDRRMCGFTILSDDTFLITVGKDRRQTESNELQLYSSNNRGDTWKLISTITADPYEHIAGSFESITETNLGTVLLPAVRHSEDGLNEPKSHVLFRSENRGSTWQDPLVTFNDVYEPHIIQLHSGKLLGAFRYQRGALQNESSDVLQAMGAGPLKPVKNIPGSGQFVFKHVFVADSFDDGLTWNNLRPAKTKEGVPLVEYGQCHGQLTQINDGRIVLVHDSRYPYEQAETVARVSQDDGNTWMEEAFHITEGHGYPASTSLSDNTLITVTGTTIFDPQARLIGNWKVEAVIWQLPF